MLRNKGVIIMKWLEWVENVHVDARVAYLLTLTERTLHKIENYEWYPLVREALDMCWAWIEEKKYSGEDLYEILDLYEIQIIYQRVRVILNKFIFWKNFCNDSYIL
jgi:Immunity protein Imm6